jgi:hypothetical protein
LARGLSTKCDRHMWPAHHKPIGILALEVVIPLVAGGS